MAFGKGSLGVAYIDIAARTNLAAKQLKGFERDLNSRFEKFGSNLGKTITANIGAAVTAGIGVAAAGIGASINAAASFGEAQNVSQLIFGDAQAEVQKFAEAANRVAGMSDTVALQATSSFGGLLKNLGIAREETVQWSQDLTVLAADMGSAFNTDSALAVEALGAGLRGEAEQLKKFNVFVAQADLQQFALAQGIDKSVASMSRAEKAQLTYQKILADTSDISGDFARTLGESLPNQLSVLKSEIGDAATQLGVEFLPIALEFTTWAAETLPAAADAAIPKLVGLADGIIGIGVAIRETEGVRGFDGGTDFLSFLTGGEDDSDFGKKQVQAVGREIGKIWDGFRTRGEEARTTGSALNEVTSAWQGRIEAARGAIDSLDDQPVEDLAETTLDAAEKAEILEDAWSNLFNLFDDSSSLDKAESDLIELRQKVEKEIADGGNTGINRSTEQGRENRENVRALADEYVNVSEKALEVTGDVDAVNARLQQQREFLILTAESFGASREEAEAYVDETLKFPTELHTDVTVDDNGSIARTNAELDAIERRRLFVEMIITSRGGPGGNGLNIPTSHTGSIRRREEPVLVNRDQWIVPNDPAGAARTARLRDSAGNTLNDVLGQAAASSVPQINNFNISTPNLDAEQTAHYIRQTFNEYAGA